VIFYYLDASAWVKRYYQEAGTRWVEDFFRKQPVVACATLGILEVIATLARKRKAAELDVTRFEEKAQQLAEDWRQFIQIRFDDEVVDLARDLAGRLVLRGADAIHLASATALHGRLVEDDRLLFVTSDRELGAAAQLSGFAVVDPQAPTPSVRKQSTAAGHVERVRQQFPRAYEKWTPEEEERLRHEYQQRPSVRELALTYQRQPSAIRSRLQRLGLLGSTDR
jgi:predicted nucleic acid-binding protein